MVSGFDSRTQRHMWVEFAVDSRPCFEVSVALSIFFSFWGRDGPRDKTSGHELLFSVSFFVLG